MLLLCFPLPIFFFFRLCCLHLPRFIRGWSSPWSLLVGCVLTLGAEAEALAGEALWELDRAWSGPAGMGGSLRAEVGANRQEVLREAGPASALHPPPWPRALRQGKDLGKGRCCRAGAERAAGSCFSGSPHSALGSTCMFWIQTHICSLFAQTGLTSLLGCIFMEDLCPNPLMFQR